MSETPELQYGNATCEQGHPLWVVEENYAYCRGEGLLSGSDYWWAWRFTPPVAAGDWDNAALKDGTEAWVHNVGVASKEAMLGFIQADIAAEIAAGPVAQPGPTYAEYLAAVGS